MSEYIISDRQLGLIQDFATVCVEGEKLTRIVRCGDCSEYNTVLYQHITCELLERYVKPNDFCSWGVKK